MDMNQFKEESKMMDMLGGMNEKEGDKQVKAPGTAPIAPPPAPPKAPGTAPIAPPPAPPKAPGTAPIAPPPAPAKLPDISDLMKQMAGKMQTKRVATDFVIVSDRRQDNAKRKCPNGYTLIDADLNKGSGGDYIYLCIRYESINVMNS